MKSRKYKHVADTPETAAKAAENVRIADEKPVSIGGQSIEEIHRQTSGFDGELSEEEMDEQFAQELEEIANEKLSTEEVLTAIPVKSIDEMHSELAEQKAAELAGQPDEPGTEVLTARPEKTVEEMQNEYAEQKAAELAEQPDEPAPKNA